MLQKFPFSFPFIFILNLFLVLDETNRNQKKSIDINNLEMRKYENTEVEYYNQYTE